MAKSDIIIVFESEYNLQALSIEDVPIVRGKPDIISLINEYGSTLQELFPQRLDSLSLDSEQLAAFDQNIDTLRVQYEGEPPTDGNPESREHLERMKLYYRLTVDRSVEKELLDKLQKQKGVAAAYIRPKVEFPIAPQAAMNIGVKGGIPDFSPRQGYLYDSPGGISANYAWKLNGGLGDGVRIIDIEGAWEFNHIDLAGNLGLLNNGQSTNIADRNHGTAVLGEIIGNNNSSGVKGISPNAKVAGISVPHMDPAAAISFAARVLAPGDLMILEMHFPGPLHNYQAMESQDGYIPAEWFPDMLTAIQLALSRNIIVIEAAGNGSQNLDDSLYDRGPANTDPLWNNPFKVGESNQAAIMVGAGAPPSGKYGEDRSRLKFSNFGRRVDCQGWGAEVLTTGYGDLYKNSINPFDEKFWYTSTFSGTSSATPMIAGAIACAQGIAKKAGKLLTPVDIRSALRATGTPQVATSGSEERIGNRPDLAKLLAHLRLS